MPRFQAYHEKCVPKLQRIKCKKDLKNVHMVSLVLDTTDLMHTSPELSEVKYYLLELNRDSVVRHQGHNLLFQTQVLQKNHIFLQRYLFYGNVYNFFNQRNNSMCYSPCI